MDDGYKTCAFCGKRFDLFRHVTNPSFWGYRWGQTYFCSWKCLRAKEKQPKQRKGVPSEMAKKLTLEQKKKAVQIGIDGGNPSEFLKQCGCDAPDQTWYYIKNKLKESNPDLYAKIPSRKGGKRKITIPASKVGEEQTVKPEPIKAETIVQTANNQEKLTTKPSVKISIREVASGKFTFTKLTDGMIVENRGRNQAITLEVQDIKDLLEVMPIVVEMFKER